MKEYYDDEPNSIDLDDGTQDDFVKVQEYESKGRKFQIISDGTFGLWHIKPKSGPLPKQLEGEFTTPQIAQTQIERYMGSYVPPNPENPEAQSTRKRVLTPKE